MGIVYNVKRNPRITRNISDYNCYMDNETAAKLLQLNMADMNYGWTIEMQIKAQRYKLKTCEIPVRYRDRYAGKSKVTGSVKASIKALIKITYIVILYFLRIR